MTQDKRLGVCVIGCGRAGMIHARNYAGGVRGARLVALCDSSADNLRAAASELGVEKTYSDYRDVMADPDVDAVVVVTPTGMHCHVVKAAAKAGKHVFCEKPMATSAAEFDEMISVCKNAGVKLQIGFMRRFDKSFRHAKEVIDSGQIGDVTLIKSLTHGPSEPKEWMFDISRSSGPIGEVNSHDFDTLRWYADSEVKTIHAIGHNFRSPERAEEYPDYYDTVAVLLEFENGVIGMVDGAQYVQYGYDARAEVLGTKGNVCVGAQNADSVVVARAGMTLSSAAMPSWRTLFRDAYAEEARSFVRCVLDDVEPEVTGYDGKMALILVRDGLRSLLEHRPIAVEA
jgi:myo-inositol 2-dehydrogenase/D-chiro-inositol 1-dehydrogenase